MKKKQFRLIDSRKSIFPWIFVLAILLGLYACASTPPEQDNPPAQTQKQEAPPQTAVKTGPTESAAQPANPPAIQVEPVITLVTTVKAGVRAEPSSKSKIIATLKKGEKITRLSATGSWLNVELSDKTTGWILKKQTKEVK